MGMFDVVRTSFPLGEDFEGTNQTKDIEEGYGGTLTDYWIDPAGRLWYPDYTGTSTMEVYDEGHPKYNPELKFMNFEWIPTGKRGKLVHHKITKYVEIYPKSWKGDYDEWPRCKIHFVNGVVQGYETFPRNQRK
jgi:hypothetical protein